MVRILKSEEVSLFFLVRPDRYVALFGEFYYDFNKWREGVPFEDQLKALQEVIDEGKVLICHNLYSVTTAKHVIARASCKQSVFFED